MTRPPTSATSEAARRHAALGRRAVRVPGGLRVGHWWRYRYDKFGWTTRSSQLYESRLLRLGSPLFHFGILFVLARPCRWASAIPKSWTEAVGVSEGVYHAVGGRHRHGRRVSAPSSAWRS